MAPPSGEWQPPSFVHMAVALLPFSIFGIIQGLLSSMVMAAELPLLTPDAPEFLSTVTAIEAVAQLCGPIIGALIDRYGAGDRIAKFVGAVGMTCGISLAIVAVHVRGTTGLYLYVAGMSLLMTANVGPMVTAFGGVMASFVAARRESAAMVSALASVYGIVGTGVATGLVGYVMPIREDAHGFYFYLLGKIVLMDVLLLSVDTSRAPPPPKPTEDGAHTADGHEAAKLVSRSTSQLSSLSLGGSVTLAPAELAAHLGSTKSALLASDVPASQAPTSQPPPQQQSSPPPSVVSSALLLAHEWLCSGKYRAFRLVLLARLAINASVQVLGLNLMFLMEDRLGLDGPEALQLNAGIRFTMLGVGLATVMPIGLLADRIGHAQCVAFGLLLYSASMAFFPISDRVWMLFVGMATFGLGGQFYSVTDTPLIIRAMPDPTNQVRDFGLYNGFGSGVGQFIGSIANPFLLGDALPPLNATMHSDDGDVRPPFPPEAYKRTLWPMAALCALMIPCVATAGYLLRHKVASRKQSLGEEHTPRLLVHAGSHGAENEAAVDAGL